MSMESRLARGDNPEDVAKLFGVPVEYCVARQKKLKAAPKKKAAKVSKRN